MSLTFAGGVSASVSCTPSLRNETNSEAVADRYDLDVADLYHALAYYHDHPGEMREVSDKREGAIEEFREGIDCPEGVAPDTA